VTRSGPPGEPAGPAPARSLRLALVRHAPTAWNAAGQAQGRADPPLDPAGRARAAAWRLPPDLARRAAAGDLGWAASPLRRALETAALLGAARPAVVPALVERDYGAWTGRPLAEVDGAGLDASWSARPPGGESLGDVLARARAWLDGLAAAPGPDTWVAVTHAGVIRALLAAAIRWDLAGPAPLHLLPGRLHRLRRRGDGHLQLEGLNEPLADAAPGDPGDPEDPGG
jgi:probable phosphoglycerate mutase